MRFWRDTLPQEWVKVYVRPSLDSRTDASDGPLIIFEGTPDSRVSHFKNGGREHPHPPHVE